jgi:hypothetical protein
MMMHDSEDVKGISEYLKEYETKRDTAETGDTPEDVKLDAGKIENAMRAALDIRKFEIDLFWKRANYFWLYNMSAFTAYFYVISRKDIDMKDVLVLLITGIGVFMSLCWVLIGKASKYWQENWEKNVDLLEDGYMGPLYKTTLKKDRKCCDRFNPLKSFKYSVSKISQLLSFGIFLVWLLLWGNQIVTVLSIFVNDKISINDATKALIVFFVTVLLPVLLMKYCGTSNAKDKKFEMRRIKIKDEG